MNYTGLITGLSLPGQSLEVVDGFKYLGTSLLDDKFSFMVNVDSVCKKANQILFLVRVGLATTFWKEFISACLKASLDSVW